MVLRGFVIAPWALNAPDSCCGLWTVNQPELHKPKPDQEGKDTLVLSTND
jgi:hypothetical protein